LLLTYKENVHSTQMYIPLKPLFSRHKGIGVQFTDEPTGNLDSKTSMDVILLMQSISRQFHQTTIMITHNEEIAQMADRTIRIEDGKVVSGGVRYAR
jgi:predicted ABC-type transport system involved in lysophospholipase L1 biosynthesis ATPase subunit